MLRLLVAGTVAAALLAGAAASAKEGRPGFPLGVAAGDVTGTSAILWARAPRAGALTLEVLSPGAGTRSRPIRVFALPQDRLLDILRRYNRLATNQ